MKIKCNNCNDIITSKHHGGFQVCQCSQDRIEALEDAFCRIGGTLKRALFKPCKYGGYIKTDEGYEIWEIMQEANPDKGCYIDRTGDLYRVGGNYSDV